MACMGSHELHQVEDGLRFNAGQDIASALEGFGAFGYVSDGYVGDAEDAAFLLHGSAIRKQAVCRLFESKEIEEAERVHET